MKPDVSIIIPLYNKERIIKRSIMSVLTQSHKNIELIIVDDGSTDNSTEIVNSIKDSRISIIEQKNSGPSSARNTGIKHSKADWIVFLDADDELASSSIDLFLENQRLHPEADVIDGGTIIRNGENSYVVTHSRKGYMHNNFKCWFKGELMPGAGHSMFRSLIIKENLYDEALRRYEDAELLFRLLHNIKIYKMAEIVLYVNTDYSSASLKREIIDEDFIGHLSLKGNMFWKKMCMFNLFLENRDVYRDDMKILYHKWYYRYDLLFLRKVLKLLHAYL